MFCKSEGQTVETAVLCTIRSACINSATAFLCMNPRLVFIIYRGSLSLSLSLFVFVSIIN